jgi:hypothetical protein
MKSGTPSQHVERGVGANGFVQFVGEARAQARQAHAAEHGVLARRAATASREVRAGWCLDTLTNLAGADLCREEGLKSVAAHEPGRLDQAGERHLGGPVGFLSKVNVLGTRNELEAPLRG